MTHAARRPLALIALATTLVASLAAGIVMVQNSDLGLQNDVSSEAIAGIEGEEIPLPTRQAHA